MKLNKTKYSTKRIISWLWQHHKGCRTQAMINVVVGLLQVGLGLWGVEILRQLTDIATGKLEGNLIWMAAVYVLVMVSEFLCGLSHTWISAVLGVKSQNLMQQQFFERLLKGRWSGIEKFHSGDVLNRLFGDVNDIVSLMTEVLPFIVTLIVQFLASFIYLYKMDASLAYIVVICCPIFMVLSRIYFFKMRRIVKKIKGSNSYIQATIQECIQHKMVIKVMEMAEEMVERLERRQSLLRWQIKTRARFSIITRVIVFIGFRGAAIVALTYGLIQIQNGIVTVGVLMAFTQLIGRIQRPLLDLGRLLPTLVNSLTSSERLMELEELPLEEPLDALKSNESLKFHNTSLNSALSTSDTQNNAVSSKESSDFLLSKLDLKKSLGIRFENVSYKYDDNGRQVINHFTYDFKPGTFTAILGETGAGKTTLLRLMLALIGSNEGQTLLYSDESQVPVSFQMRKVFSYVPQGNTLFSGSIRENLKFGNPDATTEQMYEALHVAMADFVKELPRGLETLCGEQGGGLSEGQAQRIAVARAILRPCKILLLDEATSALDVETEQKLLTGIKEHYSDKTIIFVTHRLTAVEFSTDQITMQRNA